MKFNATGRYTLLNVLPEGCTVRGKIADAGIMDEVDLTQEELEFLEVVANGIEGSNVHWLNTRMRLKEAFSR